MILRREVTQAIDQVARRLRNTRAVCRKCYVHPGVIANYLEGTLQPAMRGRAEEAALVSLLQGQRKQRRPRSLAPLLRRSIERAPAGMRVARTGKVSQPGAGHA